MDVITIGLITNAMSDLCFKEMSLIKDEGKKLLQPTFEKAYQEVISKVEIKHPSSKALINRIFRNIKVKRKILSLKGGRTDVLSYVKQFSKRIIKKEDLARDTDVIIEYFYSTFITVLKSNPELMKRLILCYYDEIALMCQDISKRVKKIEDNTNSIPEMLECVQGIKTVSEDISKKIAENARFVKVKSSNFPYRIGAFQLRLYGPNVAEVKNFIDVTYKIVKEKNDSNSKIIEFTYGSNQINNTLKLMYSGEMFKVIYPPEDTTTIWLFQKKEYVEVTCFAANYHKREELISGLKSSLEECLIKELTFDVNILDLLKKYQINISHLKYNPKIQHKVKVKGITHTFKGKIGIFSGDPGFLQNNTIASIIGGLKSGENGKHSDVYFFKALSVPNIFNFLINFDFHRDGRIIGYLPKKDEKSSDGLRTALYKFIVVNAKEF